ncbi:MULTISPECIES: VOC family protein [Halomicrobium]|uniref:Glyoxalase/bleomycin resistance protein/dioxygenase n=2 Tax=Halomicrobium mukohataei TaxID=57705 RepID=C7NZI7_HALMD|nr:MULTISPECIES: VOC family protein [Halomicrobium]ACV48755.1 Glyoxalase/bleomycin resistance protein/dioxygenase [Halomicrobium mukohataei DSM 12286]QCD64184.1 VOC family protein [Halomicrobium mukohataei]QFR18990.1 fosmidomycin resistance protein [Halomicrobium sp. ZPS1]
MVGAPRHLTLEVKYLDRAREFYGSVLDLPVREDGGDEVAFGAGDATLWIRTPGAVPRGGLHTHYAFSVSRAAADDWYERLDRQLTVDEHRFGDDRSLYCYDSDGNCVELAATVDTGDGVVGLFEIVLEVEALDSAVDFYRTLGFEVIDRGDQRRRVRLTTGEIDLELWEPQLGLADARGGVHVDWGVEAAAPRTLTERVREAAHSVEHVDGGSRLRDPDGHYLTLFEP